MTPRSARPGPTSQQEAKALCYTLPDAGEVRGLATVIAATRIDPLYSPTDCLDASSFGVQHRFRSPQPALLSVSQPSIPQ
jgi:hypothetical protein